MGRHVLNPKKGVLGNTEEIEACNIQLFSVLVGKKLVLWLQRPSEQPKYALSELIPRIMVTNFTEEDVLIKWPIVVSYLTSPIQPVSVIAEIAGERELVNLTQFPSKEYASYFMKLVKYDDIKFLKGFVRVNFSHAFKQSNLCAIIAIIHKYEKEIIEAEMERWKRNLKPKDGETPFLEWYFYPVREVLYYF